jgi:large conductance mechanosensitive channel
MLSEFKAFLARGNVLDLAVGVIIGAAFGKIVSSLTDDVLMPAIGLITGGVDFSNKYTKAAGATVIAWGSFITAVINFVILAFVIFLIVRQANKVMPPPAAGPSEVELLTEIRDSLRKG